MQRQQRRGILPSRHMEGAPDSRNMHEVVDDAFVCARSPLFKRQALAEHQYT